MPVDLTPMLSHIPGYLMVLFRLTGIFIFAPILGAATVPRQVKVLLVFVLSLCIYPMLLEPGQASAPLVAGFNQQGLVLWRLPWQIGLELLLGLVIGYAASLPLIAMQIGGHIIDQQAGLAIASIYNPELNEQSGILGEILFVASLAIFAILGGHRMMFATLLGSFGKIPIGGFEDFAALVHLVVALLSVMLDLAVQVAAPVLALMFLMSLAMGFIARTVPQFNILSVGLIIRILFALGVLVASIGMMFSVYQEAMIRMMRMVAGFMAY